MAVMGHGSLAKVDAHCQVIDLGQIDHREWLR
jgi:hypothetical protein